MGARGRSRVGISDGAVAWLWLSIAAGIVVVAVIAPRL